jgi:hypothetical protein
MSIPDPPPNSLGLDLAQREPSLESQPAAAASPSPPPQPTTQSPTDPDDLATTDPAPAATSSTKADDATKLNAPKKTPYVNPERVKTGGLPRVNLVSF